MHAGSSANGLSTHPARDLSLVVPLLALVSLACACSTAPRRADPRAEREAVLSAIDRLWDAYARKDLDTQEKLYAEDAVQIGNRRAEGRNAILRDLSRWYEGREIQNWVHTQRDVVLMGDTAFASYWDEETGLVDGRPYRVSCWVSDVWVRRDGTWHNLMSHFGANQAPVLDTEP